MTDQQDNWHLSKSVPVTFLFGLVVQAVAIVWVFTMTIANVEENREDLSRLEICVSAIEDNLYSLAVATARMDENIKAIRKAVEQMADHP